MNKASAQTLHVPDDNCRKRTGDQGVMEHDDHATLLVTQSSENSTAFNRFPV